MSMCLVEHPRSGAHWVLNTIFINFDTPFKDYWKDMFGGHELDVNKTKKKRKGRDIVLLTRNIKDVLSSVWKMSERNGISDMDFSTFLRTKYAHMQRHKRPTCQIFFDNKLTTQHANSWIAKQNMTPPELWLATNQYWQKHAKLIISYEQFQANQESVLSSIENMTSWKRKANIKLEQRVGWIPKNTNQLDIKQQDMELLSKYQKEFQ